MFSIISGVYMYMIMLILFGLILILMHMCRVFYEENKRLEKELYLLKVKDEYWVDGKDLTYIKSEYSLGVYEFLLRVFKSLEECNIPNIEKQRIPLCIVKEILSECESMLIRHDIYVNWTQKTLDNVILKSDLKVFKYCYIHDKELGIELTKPLNNIPNIYFHNEFPNRALKNKLQKAIFISTKKIINETKGI